MDKDKVGRGRKKIMERRGSTGNIEEIWKKKGENMERWKRVKGKMRRGEIGIQGREKSDEIATERLS